MSGAQTYALVVGALLAGFSLWLYSLSPMYIYLIVHLWIGVALGTLLQWGRICFASAWRDLLGMGITRMLVGLLLSMILFSFLLGVLATAGLSTFGPTAIGLHELIGGVIFGFGMVIAGGCSVGSFYKAGEGQGTSMLAALGFTFSMVAVVSSSFYDRYILRYTSGMPEITLDQYFGFLGLSKYLVANTLIGTVVPAIAILAFVYFAVARGSIMKKVLEEKGSEDMGLKDELLGFWRMLTASRKTNIATLLIALLAGFQVFFTSIFRKSSGIENFGEVVSPGKEEIFDPGLLYIAGEAIQFGGWVFKSIGLEPSGVYWSLNGIPQPWQNPMLLLLAGIVLGALISAFYSGGFKLKPPGRETALWGIGGGVLMGLGTVIALGCNIGAMYSRLTGGDPGGWLFLIGMVEGAYPAVKLINWLTERQMEDMDLDLEIE